jgi:hypothetical protein
MQLIRALSQSPCVEALVNESSILIARGNDELFGNKCFEYAIHPAGHERYHKVMYGDIVDVLSDIYENDDYDVFEDGRLEQADWQPVTSIFDVTGCTWRE